MRRALQALGQTRRVAEGLAYLGVAALLQGEHGRSESLCRAGFRLCAELGQGEVIAYNLETLACVAAARGRPVRAARLFEAAEMVQESAAARLWPRASQPWYRPALRLLGSRLDAISLASARSEGREMTREQAVEYALADGEAADPHHDRQNEAPFLHDLQERTPGRSPLRANIAGGLLTAPAVLASAARLYSVCNDGQVMVCPAYA